MAPDFTMAGNRVCGRQYAHPHPLPRQPLSNVQVPPVFTSTEHVRLAVGRNYLDATPTSGTLFVGGGGETLEVDVQVSRER